MTPPKFLGFTNVSETDEVPVDDHPMNYAPGSVKPRDENAHPFRRLTIADEPTRLVRKRLLVKRADGIIVEMYALEPVPEGATIIAGDEDGTLQAKLAEFASTAHELQPAPYKTGRRLLVDGEVFDEMADDAAIWSSPWRKP